MRRSQLLRKPEYSGDGYGYGGGSIVSCPSIIRPDNPIAVWPTNYSTDSTNVSLEFGSNETSTAEFVRDAINEKLERDFGEGE